MLGTEAPRNIDVTIVGDSTGRVVPWRRENTSGGILEQSSVARRTIAPGVLDPAWPTMPVEVIDEGDDRHALFDSVRSDSTEPVRPFVAADVTGVEIVGMLQTDIHPVVRPGGAAPSLVTGTTLTDERGVFHGGPDIREGSGPLPTAPTVPCAANAWDADVVAVAGGGEPFAAAVHWEWGDGFEPPSWSHVLVLGGSHLGAEWTSPVLDSLPTLVTEAGGTILLRTFRDDMATSFDIAFLRLEPSLEVAPGWPPAGVVVRERGSAFSLPTDVPDTPIPVATPEGGAAQAFTEQSSSTSRYFVRARALLPPTSL